MAAAAIDTAYLAASYAIPEPTILRLIDEPTKELVQSILTQLEQKARAHDELKAEKLRTEVELETAKHNGDTRAKALKASVDNGLKEVEELRRKLNGEENVRQNLETELQNLKSSSTNSSSEVHALQARITSLETSHRETVALLEAKSTAHDKLSDELSQQHQRILALRKEVSELEEKNQTLQNAAMSTRFREQSQQQEIDLLKKNVEWHENELQTRSVEQSKFRKEKGARITELQRANEDASQTIESLKRTETVLRNRIEELTQRTEEALIKTQQLEEDAMRAEESFRVDLESARRLADLHKQSADTNRARIEEVQKAMVQLRDDAASELGQIQAEIETERHQKAAAELKIAELETQVEQLEAAVTSAADHTRSIPATPRRGLNGFGTPARAGSPANFTPGSSRMKGSFGATNTQLYTENTELKTELAAQRRRGQQLSDTLDEFVRDLESKQPEIEELRAEQERLTAEVMEISALLEEATKDRELAAKEARKWQGQVDGSAHEAKILRQQLRDLSAQMKVLLVEIQARDEGLQNLNEVQRRQFEQIANGETDDMDMDNMSQAGQFISQRLLIFKNVAQLQEKNTELLRVTRDFAQRFEGEEAVAKAQEQQRERQELEHLRDRCAQFEDEVKSLNTRSQSYIKERDMYRRMLTHRGQLPPGPDLATQFGQSVDSRPTQNDTENGAEPVSDQDAKNYGQIIKDLQAHLDALKHEADTDHASLKQQIDKLAKEKGALQGQNAKVGSQLTLEHQRYELLNSNYAMIKSENAELQKRAQALMESAAKQELRTQQAAEELVEAKAIADSTRKEATNLKAEKELWRRIETRLTEDNQSLMDERSRLNKHVSDLQNLQNERELADSENRRRLQNKIEALESELTSVKRKLDEEIEDAKKATLRREYESDQNRLRIDDLVKSLGSVREELIEAKTQRDQLQARVDELKIELRNAEARAEALQPRPSTRPEVAAEESNTLSREQELAVEVADLKRDLELARSEIEAAQVHVKKYQDIAQQAEEDLQSFTATNDEYRDRTDALLAEKEAKILDLEKRVEEISTELATTTSTLTELQSTQAEVDSKFNDQKAVLEAEIARLKDESDRYQETAKLHQEDLKAQAEIAQQAQQSYENELVKHAEATTALQKVRSEYNQLRTEVAGIRAEAEAARSTLSQSEESWNESRDRYEHEITNLKTRREETINQNKLLHQQLDSVSAQIAALKQTRTATSVEDDSVAVPLSPGADNLQEVIRYLRREKEIVDVQYEMSIQEQKRLRQQFDHTQAQLDQARAQLSQERQSQIDKEQNAMSHSRLMEAINELNVFRESSTTLRNEARQAQAQLAEKVREVENLYSRIQPLEAKVQELESEIESKNDTIGLLEKLRDELQVRNQNILSKYNRIDPTEHEELKNQVATLQAERDEALAGKQPLQDQIDAHAEEMRLALEQQMAVQNERRAKLIEQSKAQVRTERGKIATLTSEKSTLATQLEATRTELESTKSARDEALAKVQQQEDTAMGDGPENGEVDEDKAALEVKLADAETRASTAESRLAEETDRIRTLQSEIDGLKTKVQELEQHVQNLKQQIAAKDLELNAVHTQSRDVVSAASSSAEVETLKSELATIKQENETLRSSAAVQDESTNSVTLAENGAPEQVAAQVNIIKADLESKHAEKVAELDATFKKRAENMKTQLNNKLREKLQAIGVEKSELQTQHDQEIQRLKAQHTEEIEHLKKEHAAEIAHLKAAAPSQENVNSPATTKGNEENTDVSVFVPAENAAAAPPSNPSKAEILSTLSENEVKDFIAKNGTVRDILKRNLLNKLASEKEAITTNLKAEHDKVLEDVRKGVADTVAKKVKDAEMMVQKRSALKLNMAENQRATAQLKLGVVEAAANETPQKAVVEVWEIAKVMKLPPKAAASNPAPNAGVSAVPATTQQPQQSAVSSAGQVPSSQGPPAQPQLQQPALPQPGIFGGHAGGLQQPPQVQSNAFRASGTSSAAGATAATLFGQPTLTGQPPPHGLPPNPTNNRGNINQRGNTRGGMGTARGALAGIANQAVNSNQSQIPQGSMIPRGGGGGGAPRGRGRGGARGGATNNTNASNAPPGGSPSSPMNPGASQFVPRGGGAPKRGREESTGDQAQKRRKESSEP